MLFFTVSVELTNDTDLGVSFLCALFDSRIKYATTQVLLHHLLQQCRQLQIQAFSLSNEKFPIPSEGPGFILNTILNRKMFHYKFDKQNYYWNQREKLSCLSRSWNIFPSKRTITGYVVKPKSHPLLQKNIIKLALRYEHVSSKNH